MLRRHDYSQLLLLILIFFLGIFVIFESPEVIVKVLTAVILGLIYPLWGIWHHYDHKHLNSSIVTEYFLVGFLVTIVLLAVIR